jgi:copper homeostasis protein
MGLSLMRKIVFELCAEHIEACLAAHAGGADRIELCSALGEGGLTPSHGLIRQAVQKSGLPVHVLLRPRSGDFIYTAAELDVMREDLRHARSVGASGIVVGLMRADGSVEVERMCELVEMAHPLEVTFHRAFDHSTSQERALEDVIATGCGRVLTSGGQRNVVRGAESLARLVKQAAGRIEIAVGGGLRLGNATAVARTTGAQHFHASMRRRGANSTVYKGLGMLEDGRSLARERFVIESSDVRQMIENLEKA